MRRGGRGTAAISRRDLLVGAGAAGLVGAAGRARAESARPRVWLGKSQAEIAWLVHDRWRDGLRIVNLSLYGTRSAPLYAVLMAQADHPVPQRWSAALSAAESTHEIERQAGDRFAPALIAAVGPPDNPLLAVVFEPQGTASTSRRTAAAHISASRAARSPRPGACCSSTATSASVWCGAAAFHPIGSAGRRCCRPSCARREARAGARISFRISACRRWYEHDPEKACPELDPG